ncbi:hypothetical protein PQX77_013072 [Marasmius sp. AFHP31]|nr:hypothetical protein PQX77_013072 [Marasmius sp. AFHP31]
MPPSPIPEALQKTSTLEVALARGLAPAVTSLPFSSAPNPHSPPSPEEPNSPSENHVSPSRPLTLTPSPPPSHNQSISPNPSRVSSLLTDQSPSGINYPTPGNQSLRTALILNRFSRNCTIMYCSNDHLIQAHSWEGRSFFDFVSTTDEDRVRSWIDTVKSWGVNERGQPSDGGFGFCKFGLVSSGRSTPSPPRRILRDRRDQEMRPKPLRNGQSNGQQGRRHAQGKHLKKGGREVAPRGNDEEVLVDAIFSAHSDGLMVILRRAT